MGFQIRSLSSILRIVAIALGFVVLCLVADTFVKCLSKEELLLGTVIVVLLISIAWIPLCFKNIINTEHKKIKGLDIGIQFGCGITILIASIVWFICTISIYIEDADYITLTYLEAGGFTPEQIAAADARVKVQMDANKEKFRLSDGTKIPELSDFIFWNDRCRREMARNKFNISLETRSYRRSIGICSHAERIMAGVLSTMLAILYFMNGIWLIILEKRSRRPAVTPVHTAAH